MVNARRSIWICTVLCFAASLSSASMAQQFVEQSSTRFPQPPPQEYTNQLTIGDIDGDGDLDIIWANGGNFSSAGVPQLLRIFINNGSGVFTDESILRVPPLGLLALARGVELGDVDGDGDLDVIVAQDFNRQPQLLINNGSGTFANETASRLPAITLSSTRAQFADIDNDGDLDLYLTNGGTSNRFGSGQGKLFLNNGSGFFTDVTAARMPAGNITSPSDAIFGDIDSDFDLDLRVASQSSTSGNSKMYRNNGAGVFTTISMPADNTNYSYDMGDMDGDGDLDQLGANGANGSSAEILLRNNGVVGGNVTFTAVNSNIVPNNSLDDNDTKFFDYDNDGDLDFVIARIGGVDRIYNNNGSGLFTEVTGLVTAVTDSSLDVKVADLNGDGRLDIVTAQGESGVFINRIYINTTGPVDTISPRIVKTEPLPSTQNFTGPYPVRVVIYDSHTSDRGFHDKGVWLNYSVDSAAAPQQVPMKWVGNSMWRGEIPGQAPHSHIEYFVTAYDFNDNLGTGETRSFDILPPPCAEDVNGDGLRNFDDILVLLAAWNQSAVTHNISVDDFPGYFTPSSLNARAGDTLHWVWVGGSHTITSGTCGAPDGVFNVNSNSASPQWNYTIPHSFSGSLPYYCIPHCGAGMVASVTVAPFPEDVNGDGVVNFDDVLQVLMNWSDCP